MPRPNKKLPELLSPVFRQVWQQGSAKASEARVSQLASFEEEGDDSDDSDDDASSDKAVKDGAATGRHYKNPSLSDIRFFSDIDALTKFFSTVERIETPPGAEELKIRRARLILKKGLIAQQESEQRADIRRLFTGVIEGATIEEENDEATIEENDEEDVTQFSSPIA